MNETTQTAPDRPFKNKRVLLIDDQRSFQVMMKAMLQNVGLNKVTILATAEEARRRCSKESFDIYLIDYNLGSGENGRQLLEHLRESKLLPPLAVVFIVSGDNSRSMVLSALESEPDDYMMKPFSQDQLRVRLLRALQRKQSLAGVFKALAQQEPQAVIQACGEALKDDSNRYANYCRCLMAEMLLREHQPQGAHDLLIEALNDAESSWMRMSLGKACYLLGQHEAAVEHLKKAVQHRPLMVEAYRWMASAQLAANQNDAAVETLERAIQISPQSGMLHQQMAEVSLAREDYLKARDSLSTLMELNRFSVQRTPQALGNYIHCLILYALHSEDPYHIANLQKQVNSALYRCRDALMTTEFDYAAFEQICQARVQMARGDLVRGKKMLYKAHQNYMAEPARMPEALLSETVLGLLQLGEFEYADQLQACLSESALADPMVSQCLNSARHDSLLAERNQKYQELNEQGILAYKNGHLDEALLFFRDALRRAPANTSAALNKIQVLIQLLGQYKKDRGAELYEECRATLAALDAVILNQTQRARLDELHNEFAQLRRP
ncbi:response regulator [Pseudaeromonas sp. ZJS20]|uniref:response regulator n=1 Tax=Pseudaeromonas aegiceratis TaxID=3153928 RepID=UPI00390C65DB